MKGNRSDANLVAVGQQQHVIHGSGVHGGWRYTGWLVAPWRRELHCLQQYTQRHSLAKLATPHVLSFQWEKIEPEIPYGDFT